MASLVWGVEDLIVKDREVEGETKTDGVCWSKIGLGNLRSNFISLQRLIGGSLALIAQGELGEIAVVVALPK